MAYAADTRWLPADWAIPQLVIGGGANAAVAIRGVVLYSQPECFDYALQPWSSDSGLPQPKPQKIGNHCGEVLGLAIGTTVLSAWFIAHGVASLVLYEPRRAGKAARRLGRESDAAFLRWLPELVVTRDRATLVAWSGVF